MKKDHHDDTNLENWDLLTVQKKFLSLIEKLRPYMYFFFSDKLRKFTISDFPKQTHFGHISIAHFITFLHHLIDPHFDIVFQPRAWASAVSTKTFWWRVDQLEGVGEK